MESFLDTLIEEITLEVVLESHRKLVSGKLCLSCPSPATDLVARDGYDVLGLVRNSTANSAFLVCSNCGQRVSSTRYAPHLEKCMGRGGRGSRTRSQVTPTPVATASFVDPTSFVGVTAGDSDEERDDDRDVYKPASKLYEKKKRKKDVVVDAQPTGAISNFFKPQQK